MSGHGEVRQHERPRRSVSDRRRGRAVDPFVWHCQRVLARVETEVEAIVAEHATCFWQRGARRRELWPGPDQPDGRVRWTIDDELVLELRIAERGAAELVVHDVGLVGPLRKAVRTRHVRVRYVS